MKHLPNNIRVVLACLLLCVSQLSMAASADQEVSHLISFIEQSKATFIRNGDEHTSEEAAEHLAMIGITNGVIIFSKICFTD